MTPTEQYNELREQLADMLEWYSRYRERDQDDDMDKSFDNIVDYITASYTPNSEVADKVKTAVATRELELDHQWSKELERKVAEREHALWAITYDFLHNRDRNLCEEWEGLTKGGDK